eukprot:CAMPEP_0183703774 /NCGR_PEP_ID=MMETSP0737-20130205/1387_1 /TAXON_ID=385413 /ORGANISM="Thalassiosira miniscula, Strain CCMP1093" /LENGTH=420 /DNA_ID=CAMNT_0025930571 /DNA_START=175 /DNA_END=1437 /DNA_ORIENTATION=-
MAFQYDDATPPIIPVAVPLPVSIDNGDTDTPIAITQSRPPLATANVAYTKRNSKYQLPSSRRNGAFAPVPEHRIEQLVKQGYTRGHATSLAQTIKNFPVRIWVVDNSGSMQKTDGHRFVETKRTQDVKVVGCSRWNEIVDCIEYHAQMAAALEAPTTFRMLNDPACGPNSQQFGIAENSLDAHVIQEEVDRAIYIMKTAQPGGVTPLVRHIQEIAQSVRELEPQLRADGCRVAIILATDGLPTDERGYGGTGIQQQFIEALRGLEGLPVWVVVRLCTDEEEVVEFYNDLDGQLELSLEVLDDFIEEAKEIHKHNPWLNYALPLHRLREMGYHDRVFDMMDERPFTHEELRKFCNTLLTEQHPSEELPDPSADWKEFSKAVKNLLEKQKRQWNPIEKKLTPWIDIKKMDKIYGDKSWYHFW